MEQKPRIVVSRDGPYLVSGGVPLSIMIAVPNEQGIPWDWKEEKKLVTEPEYRLCRCGRTRTMPLCDDQCTTERFDGTETASRAPYASVAREYMGPEMVLQDSESLCAHARFCMAAGTAWRLARGSDDPKARELAVLEASHCPSGRLLALDRERKETENPMAPSIGLVEFPELGWSGPLWVRGRIRIESEDGTPYEERNRVTLCRCGTSGNKPFCDGSHRKIKFDDGFLEASGTG